MNAYPVMEWVSGKVLTVICRIVRIGGGAVRGWRGGSEWVRGSHDILAGIFLSLRCGRSEVCLSSTQIAPAGALCKIPRPPILFRL